MAPANRPNLRAVTEKDLQQILQWRNDDRIRKMMFNQELIEVHAHTAWFKQVTANEKKFVALVESSGLAIGFVQFDTTESPTVAEWGFYKNPDAPKGAGMVLGIAALNHAFYTMGLHKVWGSVLDLNFASIAMHKRLGFVQEGLLRAHRKLGDLSHDVICYGLLSHEWKAANLAEGGSHEVN